MTIPRPRLRTRVLVLLLAVALQTSLLAVLSPLSPAFAAGTILFQNSFANRTVNGTGTVTVPTPTAGSNVACLTVSGNTATLPLLSCSTGTTTSNGKLRLTRASGNEIGGVFGKTSFPTSNGLDVTFNSYQWGGNGADGIAFMLAAVDPANPAAPTMIGPAGGSLGYSPAGGVKGLPNAYLGVGLDVYGNFSSTDFQGSGCTNPPGFAKAGRPGAVVVRGPGNNSIGYCGLATSSETSGFVPLRTGSRASSVVPVQVLINPTPAAFTSDSGVSVDAGTYKVVFKGTDGGSRTLTGPLPVAPANLYPSSTWTANGVPRQLAFGFVGSTGGLNDNHEISDVKVLTFDPVPRLAVATTSFSAATVTPGGPINYQVTGSVLTGADVASAISITQTVPNNVVPVGAFGSGWTCLDPSDQTITCTTTATSFPDGTSLPVLNVVAISTGSGVTSGVVQNNSPTIVSATDASQGTDTLAAAGTLPTTPSGVTTVPTIGSITGGGVMTISGSNITAATAIEIGTTAEQQAGTPVVLLPCPGAATAGCFTVSGNNLVISSIPARSNAVPVTVTVVTRGVAAAANFTYADEPVVPLAPTATAGVTSATVTWVPPTNNGSTITGYTLTPYLGAVAQTPISFDASTTTRTLTGLAAGGSYTFTVAATNAYGTSGASPKSTAVTPYAVPAAPTITAAAAGDSAATLTWTTPANNGSAISGYVVTPYLGAAAQTPITFVGAATTQTVTGLTPGAVYTFTVAAQNLAGTGPASAKSGAVTPNFSPSLTFPDPPTGEVGVGYSQQLYATNGTSPFAWSISAGTLPAGLTLSANTGLLTGTPTAAGSFPVTVRVLDASGQGATKAITLIIAAAPTLSFTLPAGAIDVPYSQQLTVSGGTAPFAWAVAAGNLPAGITLNASTGLLSGTPTTSGSFTITFTVRDFFNQVASRTVPLVIAARPAFTAAVPPGGQVGVAYSTTLAVTGGTAPLTWSVTAGSLPPGLTLNPSTGVLSGTPTTASTYNFTASVKDANNQTATKTVSLQIAAGPLVITKTANVSTAAPGAVVAYTITIANTSGTTWTGVNLSDPLSGVLDDAVYNANATASSGTVAYSNSTLTWSGNISGSGTITITYSVKVTNPDVGNKVLANTVTSTTLGTNCAISSTDPRCTATVTVAGLSIVKTADVATTTPGSTVRFTVVVTNTGQSAYTGATYTASLAGVLDDAAYNNDASATAGSVVVANSALTWVGNLPVGGSATITHSVTVNNPDSGDRILTGIVVSPTAGSNCPSGNPSADCDAPVTVLIPALSISNTAGVSTTTPGATVPYTVTLTNTGQTPYTAAAVTISLTNATDDAFYNNDAGSSTGAVAYTPAPSTLTWTGNIAIGGVVTITFSVTVRDPDLGDRILTTQVASTAPGSVCPAGSSNTACTSTVAVKVPQLSLTNAADVATTTPGSVVRYTATVTNTGQTPYTAASFSSNLDDVLDDAVYNNNIAASSGGAAITGNTLSWTGDLAIGATATVTYSLTVRNPDPADLTLTNTLVSTAPGNNCAAGSGDSRCTATVTVLLPQLTINNTVDAAATTPGSVLHYTVTVTNSGQTTYTNAQVILNISGLLDDATYDNNVSVSTGTQTVGPGNTAVWTLSLAPGATATGTFSATVNSPASGNRNITTQVSSNAAGSNCPVATTAVPCGNTVTVQIPGLTITKTANVTDVTPGDTVIYTIVVKNSGQTNYAAATFTDSLVNVLTDANYLGGTTATSGSVTYADPTLSWTGALTPGATATISYSIKIKDPDPGDKRISNTVVSTTPGSNCPAGGSDPRCTAAVSILVPGLTINTTVSTPTTTPGAVITYTVNIANTGATAATGISVSDTLTDILDDATYNGGATAGTGAVLLTGDTLVWTGTLAVGAATSFTYSVTVNAADVGDDLITNRAVSVARGSNCTAASTDPRCSATTAVARLVLEQSYPAATTTPGSLIRLTATFTNTGQVPYTGITVSSLSADAIDDAIITGDQTATSGSLVLSPTSIIWTGDIPVGGVVTLTGTLTVKNPVVGNKVITGTLVSEAPGNNCVTGSTDPRCTALITVKVPALTITKVASTTFTTPGGTVGYTITIQNTGETAYPAAVVVDNMTGALDDAVFNSGATTTVGSLAYAGSNLTWTGSLAVGQIVTITYSMTSNATATGDKTMVNQVSSTGMGSNCPPAGGAPACRSTVVILTPALTLVKTADLTNATLGSTVKYTITATNTGQMDYASAAFTDSLADVLDDAAYNGDAATTSTGTVGYVGGVLSWSGALAVGDTATVTYTVTIKNPNPGNKTLSNTLISTTVGNNCATGSTDTRCTAKVAVTNSVSLTFTKTANVEYTTAGSTVAYTVTVTNSSIVDESAEFTDPLAGILDDATFSGSASASSGAVTYSAPNLFWSGTVAAGATATITYSVTVLATPASGDLILAGALVSTSLPTSNNCIAGSTDPRCRSTVPVASLLIQQAYSETTTTPGSVVRLSATFINNGKYPYTGITIIRPSADTTDDAVPTGDQVASSGTLVIGATEITWTGDIPVGATVTLTGTTTIKDPDPGNKVLNGTISTLAPGSNCPPAGTDVRCSASLPILIPALTISKTANTTFVIPGGSASYTILIHNTGQTPYSDAVVTDSLVGVLDDAELVGTAMTTVGSVSFSTPTLTWTGDLTVGATATITYTVTALSPAIGDKTMINPVVSTEVGSTCPPASGNPACRSTVAVLTPALTLTAAVSTASAVPGDSVTYTFTASNTGQTPYAAASFTVPLGGILDDAQITSTDASSGAVIVNGSGLSWTGGLATGGAATITMVVKVDDSVSGNRLLQQNTLSASAGANCTAGNTDPRCTTTVAIAGLQITNATNVNVAEPTTVVTYTGSFTNTGQVPYIGISIASLFQEALDDATYNGDAVTDSGSVLLEPGSGQIVWTGDIPVGATVTVTGSLTVNNPDLGNKKLNTRITTDAPASNCGPSSTDPLCVSNVSVLTPKLTLSKTANTTTISPNGVVKYTVVITNTGQTTYPAATFTDSLVGVLDDATFVGGSSTTTVGTLGTVGVDGLLTWTGTLEPEDIAVVTYSVKVNSPELGDLNLVNTITSDSIGSSCPTGLAVPTCTSQVTVLVPVLDIAITANTTTTTPGSTVSYTVSVSNTGQTNYAGATVEALLSGALDDASYLGGSASANTGMVSYNTGTLSWTGDVAVNTVVVITYQLVVSDPAEGNLQMVTTVSSEAPGSTCGTLPQCSNTVTVLIPGLNVSYTTDVSSATPGDRVGFTISVTNTGQTPYLGTTVTSDLAGVLDNAIFDGVASATSGVVGYTPTTLSWTGSLAVGASATITFDVTVAATTVKNETLTASLVSTGAGSTCRAGSVAPACSVSVAVLIPKLSITKTAGTTTTTPGSSVEYTIIITNTGQTPYVAATIVDDLAGVLSDATYELDAMAVGGGVLRYDDDILTWQGDLSIAASVTITYSVTINDPSFGDKLLVNSVSSTAPGSSCPPGSATAACTVTVQVLIPQLSISKEIINPSGDTVTAGDSVQYRITIANTGETDYIPATVTDDLTGVLDDATYSGDVATNLGTVAYVNQTLVWTGKLAVGEIATFTYRILTNFPATGDKILANSAESDAPGNNCAAGSIDSACSTLVNILVPELTITKSVDTDEATAGGQVRYTIDVLNSGESDYLGATLTDDLSGVLNDAVWNNDATPSSGQISYTSGILTWIGDLPVGAGVEISYTVGVNLAAPDDAILVNQVTSPTRGSSCVTGAPCTTSTPIAARFIMLSGLTPSFALTGLPNTTVSSDGTVVMTVTTNSVSGYQVNVSPMSNQLSPTTVGNTDVIPISALSVRESGTSIFTKFLVAPSPSPTTSLLVHQQNGPSALNGDAVSNDYQVEIPFVVADTYTTTLEYIVSAQ